MESPIRGDKEEGPTPPERDCQLAGHGWLGERQCQEARGHWWEAEPDAGSEPRGKGEGAKWSPGRRSIVRGPELWRLLKEQLKDPNLPAFRSAWQDVELVWRVLRALVARLDLGGMGPLVA